MSITLLRREILVSIFSQNEVKTSYDCFVGLVSELFITGGNSFNLDISLVGKIHFSGLSPPG